jgi:hypothetical protein
MLLAGSRFCKRQESMLRKFKEVQQENAYCQNTLAILKNFWRSL